MSSNDSRIIGPSAWSYAAGSLKIDPQTAPYYTTAMQRRRSAMIPIVTLTTDFGLTDSYVAEIKAVLLAHCPDPITLKY